MIFIQRTYLSKYMLLVKAVSDFIVRRKKALYNTTFIIQSENKHEKRRIRHGFYLCFIGASRGCLEPSRINGRVDELLLNFGNSLPLFFSFFFLSLMGGFIPTRWCFTFPLRLFSLIHSIFFYFKVYTPNFWKSRVQLSPYIHLLFTKDAHIVENFPKPQTYTHAYYN